MLQNCCIIYRDVCSSANNLCYNLNTYLNSTRASMRTAVFYSSLTWPQKNMNIHYVLRYNIMVVCSRIHSQFYIKFVQFNKAVLSL